VSLERVILRKSSEWDARYGGPMQLHLSDPSYTDRLAHFLRSLGQTTIVAGPGQLEVELPPANDALAELRIYVRVWKVLYPDTDVHVGADEVEDDVAPPT
jgi:hypothetical protein